MIDENGRLTGETGKFRGLKVAEAREKVAEAMREKGILEKVDPEYIHQVATCYKCGTTLEPLPKPQWFVKVEPLAKKAIEAVKKGKIKILPEHSEKIYLHWLANIRDWNISRQIVWGIRIPAWFCLGCGEPSTDPKITSRWFLVRHGETDWNRNEINMGQSDIPLNETGKAQAEKAAQILKKEKVDLIISSDLSRAKETAEIIAAATGAKLVIDKRLRERHMGFTEGMPIKERNEKHGDLFPVYDKTYEGGETFQEVEQRTVEAFIHHKKDHQYKNVVLVSHGGPILTLHKHLRNLHPEQMFGRHIAHADALSLEIGAPCKKCGQDIYEQDPDVFDTWFSSGQWPFLTLGYPDGKDFKAFYPTDVMETGYDILFFWVTRMVMLGLYRAGKIPFHTVYLHGLVRDKDRQKMSKSKGNVVNPLGVAELYGTDALRMALVVGNTPGNDIIISEDKIRGYRNFTTKLWNIARFITMNRPTGTEAGAGDKKRTDEGIAKRAEIKELAALKNEVTTHIEDFEFHLAAEKLYHYVWHTLADKIVEKEKGKLRDGSAKEKIESYALLEHLLLGSLKALHPFMPFVTEEIYQAFRPDAMLMVEKW